MLKQIRKKSKQIIKKFDLFSQQVTFRYNDQPAYQTLTGGVISLILMAIFIGIFATTLYRTVEKQYITYTQSRHDQQSPSYYASPLNSSFMFAIGLDNIDVNSGDRYFDISMQFRHYNATHKLKINKPLSPCTKSQWEAVGFGSIYDKLSLNRWLCPEVNSVIQLEGKFTSDVFKFYRFVVSKCNATLNLSRPCVPNTTIETYLNNNEAFNFNFYFINTIINAGDSQYLRQYLQDVNYFPFSLTAGINADLFVSTYTIETDQSLLPIQDIQVDEGGIVLQTAHTLNYGVRGNDYLKFYLRKSPLSLSIQRSFRRIDDTLSYIGGLFSTILVILMFMNFYNQLCYQLEITKSVYYLDKNDPINSDQFNLLTFLGYLVFLLFDKFTIELNWKKYQRIHKFLEDGRKQLDIRLIIKKLMYAEKLGMTLLDQKKYKALHLQEPLTLEQAEKIRKDMRFYKNFRKKFFPSGQLIDQNLLDITDINTANKDEFMSSQLINPTQQMKEFRNNKIMPLSQEYIAKDTNLSNFGFNIAKKNKPQFKAVQIKHEQQFNEMDKQMKKYILQLKQQAERGDPLARRIFQKIDERIKIKYLSEKQRKLKLSMKLQTKIQ